MMGINAELSFTACPCSMSLSVIIKWGGQEYSINTLSEEDTVLDLKQSIKSLTGVLPERQKLLGLKVKGGNRQTVCKA